MAVILYPHNEETYQSILESFETSNRVAVVQPTGTGKSFLFLKWTEDHPADTFIILSPSTEIFTQLESYAEDMGAAHILAKTTMLTYQKLTIMSDEELSELFADKIILDEFHRIGAEIWGARTLEYLSLLPDAQILGATATPVRYLDDARNMADELFDNNLARDMTLGEAVAKGILPEPVYVPVWYDIDDTFAQYERDVASITDEKKRKELETALENARRTLENSYGASDVFRKYMPNNHGKYIVFCRSVAHIHNILPEFKNWLAGVTQNVRSYISISENADKDKQLQAFREDNDMDAVKLLFTVDRLNEGVHVKGIDGVIMLRPTVSPIIYLQQMGRALASGQKQPVIFDMVNNYASVSVQYGREETPQNVFFHEYSKWKKEDVSFTLFDDMMKFSDIFRQIEDVLYIDNEQLWTQKFELLKEFLLEFGREPKVKEEYRDVHLGIWCNTQRTAYKKGAMSAERIQLLEGIGFRLETKDNISWEHCFGLLKEFVREFGREPKIKEVYHGVNLGAWCMTQRVAYKKGAMSAKRIQLLKGIGFRFETKDNDSTWEQNFVLLKEFMQEFGKEPKLKEQYRGGNLGRWCTNQRTAYKKGTLSVERIQLLEDTGFRFETKDNDSTWEQNFVLLKEFMQEFGREPKLKEQYRGGNLGWWCMAQRVAHKKGTLSLERRRLLEGIGFRFETLTWEQSLELLKGFMQERDREPKVKEEYRDVYLGIWCKTQRVAYKKGTLSAERIQLLESIGFRFETKDFDSTWEQNFVLLKEFMQEFGREPKLKEQYRGGKLGAWCSTQRVAYKKGTLSAERRRLLEGIGFRFETKDNDSTWEQNFALLKEFIQEKGREPKVKEEYQGIKIGVWCNNQRQVYKKGTLSAERIHLLKGIGFRLE